MTYPIIRKRRLKLQVEKKRRRRYARTLQQPKIRDCIISLHPTKFLGEVNDIKVQEILNTGSSCHIVRESLVKQYQFTEWRVEFRLIDGSIQSYDMAVVDIKCPLLQDKIPVVVMKTPVSDLVVGSLPQIVDSLVFVEASRDMLSEQGNDSQMLAIDKSKVKGDEEGVGNTQEITATSEAKVKEPIPKPGLHA